MSITDEQISKIIVAEYNKVLLSYSIVGKVIDENFALQFVKNKDFFLNSIVGLVGDIFISFVDYFVNKILISYTKNKKIHINLIDVDSSFNFADFASNLRLSSFNNEYVVFILYNIEQAISRKKDLSKKFNQSILEQAVSDIKKSNKTVIFLFSDYDTASKFQNKIKIINVESFLPYPLDNYNIFTAVYQLFTCKDRTKAFYDFVEYLYSSRNMQYVLTSFFHIASYNLLSFYTGSEYNTNLRTVLMFEQMISSKITSDVDLMIKTLFMFWKVSKKNRKIMYPRYLKKKKDDETEGDSDDN